MYTQPLQYSSTVNRVVSQFEFMTHPFKSVIPKAGVFQLAEESCVGYPRLTAREIPHYA
jgi:hypothetical protein